MFCGSAGVMKALQCPFLSRFPVGQVRQQAAELLKLADLCPVMGHVIKKYATAASEVTGTAVSVSKGDSTVSAIYLLTCMHAHAHFSPLSDRCGLLLQTSWRSVVCLSVMSLCKCVGLPTDQIGMLL